tara:strand:- start:483 stop:905 length:423 start_codon:yes stop_codon:yes gene_type:complete
MISKSSKGFTIVELLVVVAIIGILSAVGVVSYNGYVSSSKKTAAENTIQQIALAQTEYYSNSGQYYLSENGDTCSASADTSSDIEDQLFNGENIIADDIDFEICIFGDGATFTIRGEDQAGGSSCIITLAKNGAPNRTDC